MACEDDSMEAVTMEADPPWLLFDDAAEHASTFTGKLCAVFADPPAGHAAAEVDDMLCAC